VVKSKKVSKCLFFVILVIAVIAVTINFYVIMSTKNQIISSGNHSNIKEADCILVLGAGIWNNKPSPMLEDRLIEAINLYNNNVADKIIMSGDHGSKSYDEVNIMKDYAIEKGVPSEDIFMDHAGFSTYESIYRAKEIFKAKKLIIVTQKYHLYRAIYIAKTFELEAFGFNSDPREYNGQMYRDIREFVARNKDFFTSLFKPKPTYLGESIPVSGNGNLTNDKK